MVSTGEESSGAFPPHRFFILVRKFPLAPFSGPCNIVSSVKIFLANGPFFFYPPSFFVRTSPFNPFFLPFRKSPWYCSDTILINRFSPFPEKASEVRSLLRFFRPPLSFSLRQSSNLLFFQPDASPRIFISGGYNPFFFNCKRRFH